MSPAEALLWSRLKNRQLGVLVRRQFAVGPYFLDFYVHATRLGIEVDGIVHDERGDRDVLRDQYVAECGIEVLRFTASELSKDIGRVVGIIADEIAKRSS